MPLDVEPRVLTQIPLAIDPDEVLRFQGYHRGVDTPEPPVRALFEEALALGRALMEPRAVTRWWAATAADAGGLDVAGQRLTIPGLRRQWGAIEALGLAVCTIGDALERRVAELWDARELPLAMMLDSVGSGAVESLAEYVNDVLCQEGLASGLRVTNRVSPGYGAWALTEQRTLFRLCPAGDIGVTLNEACFMTPTKSISLLAGAGVAARVDHYFSQCARCWMEACAYRRTPLRRAVRH
jgi:hypothetical protein